MSAKSNPTRLRTPLGRVLFEIRHPDGATCALSQKAAAARAGLSHHAWTVLEAERPDRPTVPLIGTINGLKSAFPAHAAALDAAVAEMAK